MINSRFLFCALLFSFVFFTNCKKKKSHEPAPAPVDTFKSKLQVNVDGIFFTAKEDSARRNAVTGQSANGNENEYSSSLVVPVGDPSYGVIDVTKGTLTKTGATTTELEFKNFFLPGTYSFDNAYPRNGIGINWFDNYERWSTDSAPATQSGSSFTITDVTEGRDEYGRYMLKVKATFNCTVYNSSGASKALTNGVYWGYFAKEN
jgi:hypothetical protein